MIGSRLTYLLCMIAAVAAAAVLFRSRASRGRLDRLRLDRLQRWGIAAGGLIGATLAAKAPFVIGQATPADAFAAWFGDGKTILWGLAGGYAGVELAKWAFWVRGSTGDAFVVPVAAAVAIGRIGCFAFGCCYGVPTDQSWGMRFQTSPDAGALLRHPAQLYEFAFHASFALLAWVCLGGRSTDRDRFRTGSSRGVGAGTWMPGYLAAYAAFRFVSEYWREEPMWAAGLTFYQWSSLVLFGIFGAIWGGRFGRGAGVVAGPPVVAGQESAQEVC